MCNQNMKIDLYRYVTFCLPISLVPIIILSYQQNEIDNVIIVTCLFIITFTYATLHYIWAGNDKDFYFATYKDEKE